MLGTCVATAGILLIIFGGLIAGNVTPEGHYPLGIPGFAVILIGLGVMYAGLWIAGVDLT